MGPNPLGGLVTPGLVAALYRPADSLFLLLVIACALAPIWRWRNAVGDERQQLKVLAYVAAWVGVGILAMATGPFWPPVVHQHELGGWLWAVTFLGFLVGLPIAVAVAILRYRLYDIDNVINKTLVFGGLALFVTASYVFIVVGIGSLVGSAAQANLLLSVLATAAVAIAFQPVRARAQAVADRLVFGRRANPQAVLSQISQMVAASTSTEQVLTRLLELLGAATGAAAAAIYIVGGEGRQEVAWWPAGERDVRGLAFPITHQGERLGDLVVGRSELAPADARLLADVASQAGLLLRNLRLNTDLEARIEELAESRRRIVAAQDAERRRLERDIHDGVQQQVVALMAKLRLARNQAGRHSELAAATLDEVQADAGRLLDELRDLASGIHPVLLTDGGIVAALRARADRLPIKVAINATSDVRDLRYPEAVEAAGYFIACESLANVLKHAGASRATVSIEAEDHTLKVSVTDDGRGFDLGAVKPSGLRGLEDRVEALGGRLQVSSRPGHGTTVSASLPTDG
jgi:signal transduction histidine kinase